MERRSSRFSSGRMMNRQSDALVLRSVPIIEELGEHTRMPHVVLDEIATNQMLCPRRRKTRPTYSSKCRACDRHEFRAPSISSQSLSPVPLPQRGTHQSSPFGQGPRRRTFGTTMSLTILQKTQSLQRLPNLMCAARKRYAAINRWPYHKGTGVKIPDFSAAVDRQISTTSWRGATDGSCKPRRWVVGDLRVANELSVAHRVR